MDSQSAPSSASAAPAPAGEASLLQLAQDGDREAFRQLVIQHQARVFGIALRFTGQRSDAEELAQDVFVKLHAALVRITSAAHLTHWLLRTVSHRAIDRLRQQARQGSRVSLEVLGEDPQALAPESTHDPLAAAQLRRLLLQLQPDARAVMLLRYQEDLDPTDIAAVLEMPLATVKSHLRRSLEWLRAQCAGGQHGS
ncbi:MAG TPA: RNA polymerase sigma factor [Steroidobacteraceae bacterium]|nr:RNA polymerase sigma factor [Steroidobacteraceae bacterium]